MSALVRGLLVLVPIYLSVLLLLKAMQSVLALVKPFAILFPDWLPAEHVLSFILVLIVCFLVGVAMRRECIDKTLFERLPGDALVRSLTQRLAGLGEENVFREGIADR